ncbi:MAG: hypothetical protein WKF96_00125 [Solirubrobacteraceae bacterium]
MTVIDDLRLSLIAAGIVRAPNAPGAAGRPWPPPAWRHPDTGPVGPGDVADAGGGDVSRDDGLVMTLMLAPGMPMPAGAEDRERLGVDVWLRGTAVPPIIALGQAVRRHLLGFPANPGGRTDWVMGGLYVIQSSEYKPLQPVGSEQGSYAFNAGFLFEIRA